MIKDIIKSYFVLKKLKDTGFLGKDDFNFSLFSFISSVIKVKKEVDDE